MQLRGNGLSIMAALSEQRVQISSAILNCILLLLENLPHRLACLHRFSRGMRRSPQRVAQRASSFYGYIDAPRLDGWRLEQAWRLQLNVLRLLHEASARRLQESLRSLRALLQLQVTRRRLHRDVSEVEPWWLHARHGWTHLVNVAMTPFLKHLIRNE